jgi:uncharacterized protein YgfB (UPF0149 family)
MQSLEPGTGTLSLYMLSNTSVTRREDAGPISSADIHGWVAGNMALGLLHTAASTALVYDSSEWEISFLRFYSSLTRFSLHTRRRGKFFIFELSLCKLTSLIIRYQIKYLWVRHSRIR